MFDLELRIARLQRFVSESELERLPAWQALPVRYLRIGLAVIRELSTGQLTLRAMSLVYTTLLSLVPLLAVSFSVLKGLGVHHQFEPVLLKLLAPMGEQGARVTERVMEFVENVRAGVLGTLGLGFLLYVVVSMIQKVENAFNYTWHVSSQRSLGQRFSNYLSVILVGPVLVFTALGITATLAQDETVTWVVHLPVLQEVTRFLGHFLPYAIIVAAFTFIYVFVPNTRVRIRSALAGAVLAGLLWESAGWAFTSFVASSSRYTAIYSAFAALILFMIWLFLAWLILLLGATIAFFHQNPAYLLRAGREPRLSARQQERYALAVIYLVALRFARGGNPLGDRELARLLLLPEDLLERLVAPLVAAGLLTRLAGERNFYQPARPLERIAVAEVLEIVRRADEELGRAPDRLDLGAVDSLLQERDEAVGERLGGVSIADLLGDAEAPPSPSRQAGRAHAG